MKRHGAIPKTILCSVVSAMVSALLVILVQNDWAAGAESPKLKSLFNQQLEDLDGRRLTMTSIEYPGGASMDAHSHPAHTLVYVVSGQVESSVDDEEPKVYGPGEAWYEAPRQLHATFRNASETEPYKIVAFMLAAPK